MRKVIVNLCPTGMVPTKKMNPFVPVSPTEIGTSVGFCDELKPSIIHVHPRGKDGNPTWEPDVYKRIVDSIREHCPDVLLSATTSGRLWPDFEKRSALLDLKGDYKPDLASLTLGSNNFARTASQNDPKMIKNLALKMLDNGIKPELEVFEPGMLHTANHLIDKGILSGDHPYFNILLNSPGTSPLHPATFAAFHALLPGGSIWGVAGIGIQQTAANLIALSFGGHIRLGLEDNLHIMNKGEKQLASNSDLTGRLSSVFKLLDLEVATPCEVRKMLNI